MINMIICRIFYPNPPGFSYCPMDLEEKQYLYTMYIVTQVRNILMFAYQEPTVFNNFIAISKFTYKIQNSIVLIYLQSCIITSIIKFQNIFITLKRKLILISSHYLSFPIPPNLHSLVISIDLPILGISYKWNHLIYGHLYLASFTYYNVFKVIHIKVYISTSFLFYRQITFHWIPFFEYPFLTFPFFCFS